MWFLRASALYHAQGLDSSVFTNKAIFAPFHIDYPLLQPTFQAAIYHGLGKEAIRYFHIERGGCSPPRCDRDMDAATGAPDHRLAARADGHRRGRRYAQRPDAGQRQPHRRALRRPRRPRLRRLARAQAPGPPDPGRAVPGRGGQLQEGGADLRGGDRGGGAAWCCSPSARGGPLRQFVSPASARSPSSCPGRPRGADSLPSNDTVPLRALLSDGYLTGRLFQLGIATDSVSASCRTSTVAGLAHAGAGRGGAGLPDGAAAAAAGRLYLMARRTDGPGATVDLLDQVVAQPWPSTAT